MIRLRYRLDAYGCFLIALILLMIPAAALENVWLMGLSALGLLLFLLRSLML